MLHTLKTKGYRLTKPRKELLKVISDYPLSVQEIFNKIKKKHIRVDLTSIYRSLQLFETMGMVRALEMGEDKKRYEMVDVDNHHHHLICTKCKTIEDVHLNENSFLKEMKTTSKFKIDDHHLEFFGLCAHCQ